MQLNANSVSLWKPELQHFLNVNVIDVAAVCETKLIPRRKFTVPVTVYTERIAINMAEVSYC
jgi:hypothetical protein